MHVLYKNESFQNNIVLFNPILDIGTSKLLFIFSPFGMQVIQWCFLNTLRTASMTQSAIKGADDLFWF